jgi:hypothetical protein
VCFGGEDPREFEFYFGTSGCGFSGEAGGITDSHYRSSDGGEIGGTFSRYGTEVGFGKDVEGGKMASRGVVDIGIPSSSELVGVVGESFEGGRRSGGGIAFYEWKYR